MPGEDDVDAVLVEEREQVGLDGEVAAVKPARIGRVVEDDELPKRRARRQILVDKQVLWRARVGQVVAVEHRHVGGAEVEGVVVLVRRGVVRRGVEGGPPGGAIVGVHVVIPERRPEHVVSEQLPVGIEELGVEVLGETILVDHVPGVDEEVDRGLEHRIAHRKLIVGRPSGRATRRRAARHRRAACTRTTSRY